MAETVARSTDRLCIVCGTGPREIPDRNSTSSAKKICRQCHGRRLLGDLRDIVRLDAAKRENRR